MSNALSAVSINHYGLSAAAPSVWGERLMVLFGDSITAANAEAPTDKGYFNWLNVMLGQRWDVLYNAGVGGNSTAQMLARIQTDVIDKNGQWVFVMGGVNDIAAGTSAATILANLTSIVTTLHAAGMQVIISTLTPSSAFDTAAEGTVYYTVNAGIITMATTYPWLIVTDAGPQYLDTSQPTLAVPYAGYTVDGVHPNALGASTLAAKMYTDLAANALIAGSGIYSGLATADATAGRLYYSVPNQMTAGTGGAEVAPATGDTATGFVASAGGTWSKVARSDGKPGAWQQCVIGAEADTATFGMYDITSGFVVGDVIYLHAEFESDNDWTSPEAIQLYLAALDAGSTVLGYVTSLGHSIGGGSGTTCVRVASGILRTTNLVIPTNTAKIRAYVNVLAASGTFRVSRFEIRKV